MLPELEEHRSPALGPGGPSPSLPSECPLPPRRMHADRESLIILHTLHQGSWPPPIVRMLERQVTGVTIDPDLSTETTNDPTRSD